MDPELYVIHITIKMKDTSSLLRISVSNMYKRPSFTNPNTIQVPFVFPKEKWVILSLDLLSIVKDYSDLNPIDNSIEWSWSIKNVYIILHYTYIFILYLCLYIKYFTIS